VSRAVAARAFLALIVLGVCGWLVATRPPKLGLDLRGGTQIVLETKDGELNQANRATTDQTLEVLRRRVDELGVTEPTLLRSGDRRIIVELPGVTDPATAVAVIGKTAQLAFRPVLAAEAGADRVLPDESGRTLPLGPVALAGQRIDDANAVIGELGGWEVVVKFADSRAEHDWQRLSAKLACAPPGDPTRRLAIVLDDKVISSPEMGAEAVCDVGYSGDSMRITGRFTADEAKDLALLIRAGALPVPVEIVEQRTVGPTLGRAAIDASTWAALIGVAATMLFIAGVYRIAGGLAAVALAAYGLVSYAALLALGATLTLPGLAGFVLAIGMAIDANVLVFERAREEFAGGRRSLPHATERGFRRALSAIADSNVTTLLAAGLLFVLASGPVRGFGVTLSVGVIASMFTALILTRLLLEATVSRRWLWSRPAWSGLGHAGWVRRAIERREPALMSRGRLWLAVSTVAVVLAFAGIASRGLNLGVEFTGGRMVEYTTAQPLPADTARAAVESTGLPHAVVNESGDGNVAVRAGRFDDGTERRVRTALAEAGGGTATPVRDELVGPSLGAELRRNALVALTVALAAQLLYLTVRFQWRWGAAAVLAMLHDVVLVIGVFAWLGRPVDGVFLAALLTVIGYSVNDTVVVFDRIRELVRGKPRRRDHAELANRACLQTIPRTVNTGLGAVFILGALAILGSGSLVDFALALLVGIGVGTYSSVFLATPLAVRFEPGTARR
jgi:SecD/SecF fusion protein